MTGPSRAVPGAVCGVVLALAVLLTAADAHAQRPEIPDSLRAMLLQGSAVDVHVSHCGLRYGVIASFLHQSSAKTMS
jgi:hypothetical protein